MKWIWGRLRSIWYLFTNERDRKDHIAQYVKFLWAWLFHRRPQVRQQWTGEQIAKGKHVAVFVHWDKNGIVHDYVLHYLRDLAKAGRDIIFVTNSRKFPANQREKVIPLATRILWRHNRGYDFGAYADGIAAIGNMDQLDSILICNDSVYGPIFPLKPLLQKMDPKQADIWAMTDSWDTKYHLQSYFLLFHKKAIQHEFFARRWLEYVHVQSKSWVINKHEIGLSGEARKAGLRTRAMFRYRDQLAEFFDRIGDASVLDDKNLTNRHRAVLHQIFEFAEGGAPLNASHFFWDQLLMDGYPFIKREILQQNPMNLPGLYKWENLVQELSDYDLELINDHLEATMRGRFM